MSKVQHPETPNLSVKFVAPAYTLPGRRLLLDVNHWRMLSTPSMSGPDNMAYDLGAVERVSHEDAPPTVRFFRFNRPTVSYGRLQRKEAVAPLIPNGWDDVQRPTGGGIVFHEQDLCLSLCWRQGQTPLPTDLKDCYTWIHRILLETLRPSMDARLASCRDCSAPPRADFATRQCFVQPVASDVILNNQKIVGGALCKRWNAFLYQGSIQTMDDPTLEPRLKNAFLRALRA